MAAVSHTTVRAVGARAGPLPIATDRQMARYASALAQAGFLVYAGGMAAGLLELSAMWWGNQYWPFASLTKLIGTCTACDSGLAGAVYLMALEPAPMAVGCLYGARVDASRNGAAFRSVVLDWLRVAG